MKRNERCAWLACLALLFSVGALSAEHSAVVKNGRINVRGQPSLVGEVITQLQEGEKVVVLEEVPSTRAKTNEPVAWARIKMPANTPVWVFAPYVDPTAKTVKVSRLNLRAGPGENYSVVGRLAKGEAITEIRRVEDWMEIETPPEAYAFVAADLLSRIDPGAAPATQQEPAPTQAGTGFSQTVPENAPTPPEPNTAATSGQPAPSTPPASAPSTGTQPPLTNQTPDTSTQPLFAPAQPAPVQPLPELPDYPVITSIDPPETETVATPRKADPSRTRRTVRREGIVRSTMSIQAPTYFQLISPENRKTINYLHAENLEVSLKNYRGRRIVVTGEEAIDPRWPRTPVIEVETLELIP